SPDGQQLLTHELAHVAQQARGGSGMNAEAQARASGERAACGESVKSTQLGGASLGLYRQEKKQTPQEGKKEWSVFVPWSRPPPTLQPPALLQQPDWLHPPERQPFVAFPRFGQSSSGTLSVPKISASIPASLSVPPPTAA